MISNSNLRGALADKRLLLAVLVPTLVGLLIAAWNLGGKPLWYDETFEAVLVMLPPLRFAYWMATFETSGALYHSFLWVWKFLGTSEAWLRIPSVVFAVAAVPVTFFVARRVVPLWWAAFAATLLCVGSLWLSHAQEVRPYALYLLMAVLSTLALLRATEQPSRVRWLIYAVLAVAGVWTHLMMVFVLLAHGVAVLFHPNVRQLIKPAAASIVVAGVSTAPIVWSISHANQARWYWITAPTPEGLVDGLRHLVSDPGYLLTAIWLTLALMGAGWAAVRFRSDRLRWWPVVVLVTWAVIPILVPWMLSFVRHMYTPRYILPALPALVILVTLGLSVIRPRVAAVGVAAGLVLMGAIGVQSWHANPQWQDWRTAIRTVVDGGTPADGLAYFYRGPFDPGALYEYRYYLTQIPGSSDRPTMIYLPDTNATLDERIDAATASYQRLWFIGYDLSNPDKAQGVADIERAFTLQETYRVFGLDVRLYVRNPG